MPAQAATEEGVVVGGGCCLLRLSLKVDAIKEMLDNDDQKVSYYVIVKEHSPEVIIQFDFQKAMFFLLN